MEGPTVSSVSWIKQSPSHMRPVLMVVPVPLPSCPYAAWATMIMSQSGASGWTSWAISSCYQTPLDRVGRNKTSSSPDQLYPDSRRWEKPVSPQDSDKRPVFPWCDHPQPMPMWHLDSSSGLPNTTGVFGDATLWHSCALRYHPLRQPTTRQPTNEFKNSRWDIGWHDCQFVLKLHLCTATAQSWMYSIKIVFWSN